MARKFSVGFFLVLLETLGIFWVFIFAPIRSSLPLEIQSITPRALKRQGILQLNQNSRSSLQWMDSFWELLGKVSTPEVS